MTPIFPRQWKNESLRLAFFLLLFLAGLSGLIAPQALNGQEKGKRILNVGYSSLMISNVDLKDAQVALKVWSDMLERDKKGQWEQEASVYKDTQDLVQAYKEGKADIIAFTVLEYLLNKDQVEMTPELVGNVGNDPCQQNLLLVHKSSGITDLKGLRGKKLIVENMGTGQVPFMWLEILLKRLGLEPVAEFFSQVKVVQKPSQAATPVFFRQADACIVRIAGFDTLVEMNPQFQRDLRILASSPAYLRGITCYRKNFDPEDRKELMASALKLHETAKGQQILTLFKVDRIVLFKPEFLKTAEGLLEEYQRLFPGAERKP